MTTPVNNKGKVSISVRVILVFIYFLIMLNALYFFIQSPFFHIKEIVVQGNQTINSEEIIRLSGAVPGTNIFLLKEKEILDRLYLHPFIDEAKIERHLPNKLRILVKERVPCVLLPVDKGFMAIDKQGVYLASVDNIVKIDRPVVTGCAFSSSILPGQILQVPVLNQLLAILDQMDPGVIQEISEIKLEEPQNIKIYSLDGIEIRVGTISHFREHLQLFEQILTVELRKINNKAIEYVDMSFEGIPVYK